MSRRTVPQFLTAVAVSAIVISIIGFVTTLILNAFVFDDYDAYGEVPIPGSATVHLPAGEATISLHTMMIGGGGVLPVPKMSLTIAPPAGVAEPQVTEDMGSTTTVNNDAHIRVWVAKIPADGDYTVTTDGQVSAYVNPTLAFGHGSWFGYLPWVFVGVFALAVVALIIAGMARKRASRRSGPPPAPHIEAPERPWVPTDQGVRIEQLNTLARLRDSGALTAEEFEAEKKRLLGGY